MKKKEITFTTKDNILLSGVAYQTKFSHSVMLLFLGLGGSAMSKSVDYFALALAKKGVSTVVFSARGHGESEGLYSFLNHQSDIVELEKKYSFLAKKNNLSFVVAGHSLSGHALIVSGVSSDVILFNPGLFHQHPSWAKLPVLRRVYLAWWNFLVFRRISFTHFGRVNFSKKMFTILLNQLSFQKIPSQKLSSRCLLLMGSSDSIAKFDDPSIRSEVKTVLKYRYLRVHSKLFLGLNHEFADHSHSFMRTDQLNKIINAIILFSRTTN